jgi:hypothetical protein
MFRTHRPAPHIENGTQPGLGRPINALVTFFASGRFANTSFMGIPSSASITETYRFDHSCPALRRARRQRLQRSL